MFFYCRQSTRRRSSSVCSVGSFFTWFWWQFERLQWSQCDSWDYMRHMLENDTLPIMPINDKCRVDESHDLLIDLYSFSRCFSTSSWNDKLHDLSLFDKLLTKTTANSGPGDAIVKSSPPLMSLFEQRTLLSQEYLRIINEEGEDQFSAIVVRQPARRIQDDRQKCNFPPFTSIFLYAEKNPPSSAKELSSCAFSSIVCSSEKTPIVYRMFHAWRIQCLFRIEVSECIFMHVEFSIHKKKKNRGYIASKARSTRFCYRCSWPTSRANEIQLYCMVQWLRDIWSD